MNNIITFDRCCRRKGRHGMVFDITVERKKEIEAKVNELLINVDFTESPYVDIVKLVESKGFKVETSGILYADNKIKRITVNKEFKNPDNEEDVVFKKSRFITAHEYGHYVLHYEEGQAIVLHRDTDHRTEQEELEADYFARSILMPLARFKVYYEVAGEIGKGDEEFIIKILSMAFKVTKNKVNKRIDDLKVLV